MAKSSKTTVTVSFFSALNVKSRVAVRVIAGETSQKLYVNILNVMQDNEHYACYRTTSGQVVALDRYGAAVCL